eukprot:763182-Hanusia_phi.AAC.4
MTHMIICRNCSRRIFSERSNRMTNVRQNKAESSLSAGVAALLEPVALLHEEKMKQILTSQQALEKKIDEFSAVTPKYQEIARLNDADNNAMLSFYSSKLATSRKRLKKVESTVMQIQDRVENIARMHEQLLAAEKKQEQQDKQQDIEPTPSKAEEVSSTNQVLLLASSACVVNCNRHRMMQKRRAKDKDHDSYFITVRHQQNNVFRSMNNQELLYKNHNENIVRCS